MKRFKKILNSLKNGFIAGVNGIDIKEFDKLIIIDNETNKEYSNPYDLIIDTKISDINPCMFDNAEFAITEERLLIIGNCNDIIELPSKRFKLKTGILSDGFMF